MPGSSPDEDVVDLQTQSADPVVESTAPQDGQTPESSNGDTGGTMLDAVKAAIAAPKADSPVAKTPEDAPADDKPTDKDPDDEEFSPEESKNLSEKTQRRFKYLTSKLKSKDDELAALSPKAKELDDLNRYVRDAGLSNNDVAGTLEIAAMLRHNPRGALDRLMPIVRQLSQAVGEIIPPELQARVDQGFLTPEDAKAQARATADARLANQRMTQLTEQQKRDQAVNEAKTLTDDSMGAVKQWELSKAKSDPDWHLKQKDIAEQVELMILQESARKGQAWFPDKATTIKFSEDALKKVNERYSRFTPKPQAITPAVGTASTASTAAPKNMLEVVKLAAGKG